MVQTFNILLKILDFKEVEQVQFLFFENIIYVLTTIYDGTYGF